MLLLSRYISKLKKWNPPNGPALYAWKDTWDTTIQIVDVCWQPYLTLKIFNIDFLMDSYREFDKNSMIQTTCFYLQKLAKKQTLTFKNPKFPILCGGGGIHEQVLRLKTGNCNLIWFFSIVKEWRYGIICQKGFGVVFPTVCRRTSSGEVQSGGLTDRTIG